MKTAKSILTLALTTGLAAFAAQAAFTPPSSLSLTNPMVGVSNVLWDFTQLTNPLQNVDIKIHKVSNGQTNTEVEVTYGAPCAQDGRGKLAGAGTSTATIITSDDQGGLSNVDFDGKYSSKGSVAGAKGVTRVTFTTRVSGTAPLKGQERAVAASVTYTVKFDAVKDQISGHQVSHAAASGLGAISEAEDFSDTLSSNNEILGQLGDGTWTLVLNFDAANGNKLSGTATVTLSTGTVYPFTFTGNFAPRTGQSKLNLKGHDSAKGSILQVTLAQVNDAYAITRIVGLVSGQSVNIKQ